MEPLFPGARGGDFKSLPGAIIPRLKPVEEWSDEDLLFDEHYADSSADLQAELESSERLLDEEYRADNSGTRPSLTRADRGKLRDNLPKLRLAVQIALQRELRTALKGRPAGCWCLGLGGRGRMGRGEGVEIDARAGVTHRDSIDFAVDPVTGLALERAAQYCTCPEGTARREREARRRTDWLSGFQTGRETERLIARCAEAGLPPPDEMWTLEQFPQRTAEQIATYRALLTWKPPRWLYMYGLMRLGKTTLAQALALKALRRGMTVRFESVDGWIDHLKAGIGRGEEQEDLINWLARFDFVVLDDIGASRLTEFSAKSLKLLLDYRLTRQLTTVFTSNRSMGLPDDEPGPTLLHALGGPVLQGKRPDPAADELGMSAARIVARIKQEADLLEVKGPPLTEPARRRPPISDW